MSAYQETKVHGTHDFPFAVYRGLVPEWLSDFPLHWHEEMEIIYVEKGSVSISIRNTEYLVRGGEFVLIHPQTIHSIRQHEDDRGFYHNILFRFSMLESGADDLCRKIEPAVCPTSRRFEVLKACQEASIPTVVWFSPLLPFINAE